MFRNIAVLVLYLSSMLPAATVAAGEAQILRRDRRNSYLVSLAEPAARTPRASAEAVAREYGGTIRHIYDLAIRGFAVDMPESRARAMARDRRVKRVEEDATVSLTGVQTGDDVVWGLDRIDQRYLPLDGAYVYPSGAVNTRVYVIDTGIGSPPEDTTPATLDMFVQNGYTVAYTSNGSPRWYDSSYNGGGHGTKVASIIGGSRFGVAKGATIINVRVMRESHQYSGGFTPSVLASDIAAGINWMIGHHMMRRYESSGVAVMAMKVDTYSLALEQAVIDAIDAGIPMVVPAGQISNTTSLTMTGTDACSVSPARLGKTGTGFTTLQNPRNRTTITVAASTSTDQRHVAYAIGTTAWSSNYGTCVDLFAPTDVQAIGTNGPASFSGTSASAPVVAGVLALYLNGRTQVDPDEVEAILKRNATAGVLSNVGDGSPNLLVYSRVSDWQ